MKKNTERIAILSRTVYEAEALSGLFFFCSDDTGVGRKVLFEFSEIKIYTFYELNGMM